MKVCLVTPEFLPSWGGVGAYAYHLARGIRDAAEVHVVTGRKPAASANGHDFDGLEVHPLFPNGGPNRFPNVRFQWAVRQALPDLVENEGMDIVHVNHAYMSDLLLPPRGADVARVLTVHTTLDTQVKGTRAAGPEGPRQRLEANLSRFRHLLLPVERRYLKGVPHMIFVSRWVRERAHAQYGVAPRTSAVVPNGVDLDLFAPRPTTSQVGDGRGADPPILLFAGRLLALKGIATLLEAAASLDRDFRLLVAGPGEAALWEAMARRLGLSPAKCPFLGPVPYEAMPALYRSATAVVLPSFAESCPMVALEALASATPLVAAAVGGVQELVAHRETGWLVPPGDPDELAAAIERVLDCPDEAATVAARGRRWVEEHCSVNAMTRHTLAFYEEVLTEGTT